jgi:hypothetical protein
MRFWFAILALLSVLLVHGASSATQPDTYNRWRRVLIVGDSEACNVATYAWEVSQELHQHDLIDVACRVGSRVEYWGAQGHLANHLAQHPKPDVVVVFLGTNHYYERVAPVVAPILDQIEQQGSSCVWVGNVPVRGHRWPINGLLRAAVTPRCTYFDTEAAQIPLADGIHPTVVGAQEWLRKIWPLLPKKDEMTP